MNEMSLPESKEKLREILSRDEYVASGNPRGQNPVVQWLEKGWKELRELFFDAGVPPGTPKLLAYILIIIVLLLLAAAVLWLARNLILQRRSSQSSGYFRSSGEMKQSSRMQYDEAGKQAEQGNYGEAVRLMFLAMLLMMDEQGWVRAEKWKTNFEYAEELSDRQPAVVESFKLAARVFENVHYGKRAAGVREYEQIADLAARHWREGEDDA